MTSCIDVINVMTCNDKLRIVSFITDDAIQFIAKHFKIFFKRYLDTFPKNDVILFSRKNFIAVMS